MKPNMKYLIRSVKYFFYFAILFGIIVCVIFYTSKPNVSGITVFDLFKEGSGIKILIFFIAVSILYPALGFTKKKIYTNNNFAEKKAEIVELFENAHFVLVNETPTTMTFILRNKLLRLIRMYEDTVVIDFSENPVTISGLRKDILRFSRGIEFIMRKGSEE